MSIPLLSIIIPALNEERRLPASLEQVFGFLDTQDYEAEVVVVENGSTDRTLELVQGFARHHKNLRVIHEPQRGKGRAVRRGMLEAQGQYRFMCDADLSMPIEEVSKFLPPQLSNFDIAIGSREVRGAVRYDEPPYRHLGGRLINVAIRAMMLPGIRDTQCGFKCFRGEVASDVFGRQLMDGWSFDVEVLFLAEQAGYKLVEVPINWYYRPESKVRAVRDAIQVVKDMLQIRRNMSRGLYDARRS